MHTLTLTGASWCPSCRQARQWLDAHGVSYVYRDVDRDPVARAETSKIPRLVRTTGGFITPAQPVDSIEGFDPVRYAKIASARPLDGLGQASLGSYIGIGATVGLAAGLFWFMSRPPATRRGSGPRSSQLRSWGER